MIDGIDVSHHQPDTPPLSGLRFLVARATYGVYPDDRYLAHVRAARAAGLVAFAYAFGRAGDVGAQVAAFLAVAGDADGWALDLEADGGADPMTHRAAAEFIARVQGSGRPCGLYHSTSGYPDLGQSWRWVADYRPIDAPPIPWDIWQWQGHPLDRDIYRGSTAQLRAMGRTDMRFAKVIDGKALPVGDGDHWLYVDGTPGGTFHGPQQVPVLGTVDARAGQFLCRITTGRPYDDSGQRPTLVLVRGAASALVDVPPGPIVDCDDAVAIELDSAATRAAAAVKARP